MGCCLYYRLYANLGLTIFHIVAYDPIIFNKGMHTCREFLVDLIANPGDLSCPELFLKSLQPLAIASPLRLPQWRASEALGDDGNEWKSSRNSGKGSEVGYTTHSCQASLCAGKDLFEHTKMCNLVP